MKLNNLKGLFSFKGLTVSIILLLFCYIVGFLGGLLLEMFYNYRGKSVQFLGKPIKNIMGIALAFGSWTYMVWLLVEKSRETKKGPKN